MSAERFRLEIGQTWDGEAVGEGERAVLELERRGQELLVSVEAPFHGDPPPPGPPGPKPGLWEHEVMELFLAGPGGAATVPYLEVELSPHGHHLALCFLGVRQRLPAAVPMAYSAQIRGERWRGQAQLALSALPPGPLRANAYALHGEGPARRFLAATPVPGPRPDFHRPDLFPPLLAFAL